MDLLHSHTIVTHTYTRTHANMCVCVYVFELINRSIFVLFGYFLFLFLFGNWHFWSMFCLHIMLLKPKFSFFFLKNKKFNKTMHFFHFLFEIFESIYMCVFVWSNWPVDCLNVSLFFKISSINKTKNFLSIFVSMFSLFKCTFFSIKCQAHLSILSFCSRFSVCVSFAIPMYFIIFGTFFFRFLSITVIEIVADFVRILLSFFLH